jgi:hypothetical protein
MSGGSPKRKKTTLPDVRMTALPDVPAAGVHQLK